MTRCRALLAIEALALLGIVVWALARPVTAARGRDEIDYRHLQPLPLAVQQKVAQAVSLQEEQFSGIAIPYQLPGSLPARIRVLVTDAHGLALIQVVQLLPPSKLLAVSTVRVEGQRATGTVTVTIQRVDDLGGQLTLGVFPTGASGRPSMLGQPDSTLAVETLYGAWRPALGKVPLYATRIDSLAPPWLQGPVGVALTAVFLMLSLALVTVLATRWVGQDGPPVSASAPG
jgi:hypothetical protein